MVQPFLPEVNRTLHVSLPCHLTLSQVLKVLYDKTAAVRQAALATVTLVIRHGLSNPTDIIPCTIALVSDRAQGTASKALSLLQFISEKHATFLQLRITDGIKASFEFQEQNYGSASVYSSG